MRKLLGWPGIVILLVFIAALGATTSFTISELEERDTFCTSCHTIPEVTYQQRAALAAHGEDPAPDLSSAHYQIEGDAFRCIGCHRGEDTLPHRLITNGLAARDALIWLTGGADPTLEKGVVSLPMLLNAACARCHEETLLRLGFENHFHVYLPEAHVLLQAGAELILPTESSPTDAVSVQDDALDTTVSCANCHKAHVQVAGAELQGCLDLVNDVYPACETCHSESGLGPQQLSRSEE